MKITKSNIDAIAASRRRRQRLLAMADDGTTIEETPAEDPYPWVWSWDAREQFIGNTIFAFLSSELDGGYRSSSLSFSTNTGFGVHMAHDGSSNKMGALVPYFDIFDEDMTKQDGTSVTSGDLNTAAVSASGSDGEYLTIIYSGYVPGSGFSSSDIGLGTVYWTQAARTLSIDSVADYSSVVSMDNFNIEGDLIYVTHQMKGSAAPLNDGSNTSILF